MSKQASGNSQKDSLVATLKWILTSGSERKTAKKFPQENSKKDEEKLAWKGPIPFFFFQERKLSFKKSW
jgi:hypothetical protein